VFALSIVLATSASGCVSMDQLEPLGRQNVEESSPISVAPVKKRVFSDVMKPWNRPAVEMYELLPKPPEKRLPRPTGHKFPFPDHIGIRRIEVEHPARPDPPKPAVKVEHVWQAYRKLQFVDTIEFAGAVIHDERHEPDAKAESCLLGGAASYLLNRREPAERFFQRAYVFEASIQMDARVFPKHLRDCFERQRPKGRTP